MINVLFVDLNSNLIDEIEDNFKDIDEVKTKIADIFDIEFYSAIVSPANSRGIMCGGIDGVYARKWPKLEKRVRKTIDKKWFGLLPVGAAEIIKIGDKNSCFENLIVAPTMYDPGSTIPPFYVYLAFRATLVTAINSGLTNFVCPGMGTGVGGVDPKECAYMMRTAWNEVENVYNR